MVAFWWALRICPVHLCQYTIHIAYSLYQTQWYSLVYSFVSNTDGEILSSNFAESKNCVRILTGTFSIIIDNVKNIIITHLPHRCIFRQFCKFWIKLVAMVTVVNLWVDQYGSQRLLLANYQSR